MNTIARMEEIPRFTPGPAYTRGARVILVIGMYRGIELALRSLADRNYYGCSTKYAQARWWIERYIRIANSETYATKEEKFYLEAMLFWDTDKHCFVEPEDGN